MGKSAKFYKRPSKKEKEVVSVKKLVEPSAISKMSFKSTISVPASIFQDKYKKPAKRATVVEDVDMMVEDKKEPVKAVEVDDSKKEIPDYVDLFSGKKTYKKIPKKRK